MRCRRKPRWLPTQRVEHSARHQQILNQEISCIGAELFKTEKLLSDASSAAAAARVEAEQTAITQVFLVLFAATEVASATYGKRRATNWQDSALNVHVMRRTNWGRFCSHWRPKMSEGVEKVINTPYWMGVLVLLLPKQLESPDPPLCCFSNLLNYIAGR